MRSLVTAIKKWIAIFPVAMGFPLAAQWLNHPDPGTPRQNNGSQI